MARKQSHKESVQPTISAERAIELLRQQLSQIDHIEKMTHNDPEIKKWELTTTGILDKALGKPDGEMDKNTYQFAFASGGPIEAGELEFF